MENYCLHVLLVLFSFYSPSLPYVLLDSQTSTVNGGDVQHYTIRFDQVMIVCLISDIGDADMFASTVTNSPDSEDYEYSSTSTGIDIITVPYIRISSLSLGIHGHVRYNKTKYRLYIIAPSKRDYMDYQVWEIDPETNQSVLIIEIDPLWLTNEPRLCKMLNRLADGSTASIDDELLIGIELSDFLSTFKDWLIWIFMILLKIIVEVLG